MHMACLIPMSGNRRNADKGMSYGDHVCLQFRVRSGKGWDDPLTLLPFPVGVHRLVREPNLFWPMLCLLPCFIVSSGVPTGLPHWELSMSYRLSAASSGVRVDRLFKLQRIASWLNWWEGSACLRSKWWRQSLFWGVPTGCPCRFF